MASSISMHRGRQIDTLVGPWICMLLFAWARLRARFGGPTQVSWRETTPPRPGAQPAHPRRVLGVKLYGLGNVAMLLPVVEALRRGAPGIEIDFLTLAENRPLLERSGLVRRVIPLGVDGYGGLIGSLWRALREMRAARYDAVVDFEQFVKLSAIVSYLSGAPERVGFNTDGQRRGALYTKRVVYRDGDHMQDTFARLLQPLGVDVAPRPIDVPTREEEEAAVDSLLDDEQLAGLAGPLVAVHVGSGPNFYYLALKRWPVESFAELADRLVEQTGARIVFTGKGEEEAALVRDVRAQMKRPALDTVDRLGIGELLALLKRAELTLSNDTSVMHLSSMVGTRVAAFFGPTDPVQYGPRGAGDLVFTRNLYCSPCLTNFNLKISYCSDPVCMKSVTVDEVSARLVPLLGGAAVGS